MNDCCRLCGNQAVLLKSHILPAFVFKWLKQTSGNTYIRYGENPNKRVQDGIKLNLLCANCEGLFNSWETEFSRKIFYPYNSDPSLKLSYSEWYAKFCTSISWRVLTYQIKYLNLLDKIEEHYKDSIQQANMAWSDFLLGRVSNPGKFEQHVLPLGPIEEAPTVHTPNNINRFLLRNIELDVVRSPSTLMTYAKLGRFMVFGFIMPTVDKWRGSKVAVSYGRFEPRRYELPYNLQNFIFERARSSANINNKISKTQKEKIDKNLVSNIKRYKESELFKAVCEDYRLFGESAIVRKDE